MLWNPDHVKTATDNYEAGDRVLDDSEGPGTVTGRTLRYLAIDWDGGGTGYRKGCEVTPLPKPSLASMSPNRYRGLNDHAVPGYNVYLAGAGSVMMALPKDPRGRGGSVSPLMNAAERWLSLTGWLSPDGIHHSCRWQDHDQFARETLGRRVSDLEAEGWCRITLHNGSPDPLFAPGHECTDAQAAWLLEHTGLDEQRHIGGW